METKGLVFNISVYGQGEGVSEVDAQNDSVFALREKLLFSCL